MDALNGQQNRGEVLTTYFDDFSEHSDRTIPLATLENILGEAEVGWFSEHMAINGLKTVVLRRQDTVKGEIMDQLDLGQHQKPGERLVGKDQDGKLAIVSAYPLKKESVATLFGIEKDIHDLSGEELKTPEKEIKRLDLTPKQAEVLFHITLPEEELAKKLNTSLSAVKSRVVSIRRSNGTSSHIEIVKRGYHMGGIDMSKVSQVSAQDALTDGQKEYMRSRRAANSRSNSSRWNGINRALGAKTISESIVMAIRDGVIT